MLWRAVPRFLLLKNDVVHVVQDRVPIVDVAVAVHCMLIVNVAGSLNVMLMPAVPDVIVVGGVVAIAHAIRCKRSMMSS